MSTTRVPQMTSSGVPAPGTAGRAFNDPFPLMFSVWPAFSQSRAANSETLRGGRIFGSRFGRQRGNLLIVSQVAMALSLLVVSALAVQSMLNLRRTSIGMDANHLLTFKFDLPGDRYPNVGELGG